MNSQRVKKTKMTSEFKLTKTRCSYKYKTHSSTKLAQSLIVALKESDLVLVEQAQAILTTIITTNNTLAV